jgi:hypothetical protein
MATNPTFFLKIKKEKMHGKHDEKGAFGQKRVTLIDKGGFHLAHHWV